MNTRCTTHFHACDCREERFKELQAQLDEAVKILEFYADHKNWLYNQVAITKDVSMITKGIPKGLEFESGGKCARQFLVKIKKEKETT